MSENKSYKPIFIISIICYVLMSASVLLFPMDTIISDENALTIVYVAAAVFWSGLVIGVVCSLWLTIRLHSGKNYKKIRIMGLTGFFSNIYAVIADVVLISGLIGLIIMWIVTNGRGYICYVMLGVSILSFCMHCIFNGNAFYNIYMKK